MSGRVLPRQLRRVAAALAAVGLLAGVPATASAHPLGNFTTNHYLGVTVSSAEVNVDLVIDVAEIPSIELLDRLDGDGDGTLDSAETDAARRALCAARQPDISINANGEPLDLQLFAAGLQERPGAGGLTTIRIVCELRAPNPAAGEVELLVADAGDPDGIGWREIVVRGDGYRTDPEDAGADVSARLTAYPSDLLAQPLVERSATVRLLPGGPRLGAAALPVPDASPLDSAGGGGAGAAEAAGVAGASGAALTGTAASVPGGVAGEIPFLPDLGTLTLGTALLGLLVAAVAGAGHALSPGHGKTVMAAYLVGTRGKSRHALLLGAAVTVSHTLGVLGLAAVVLLASDVLPAQRLYPVLAATSGIAVTLIGAWLLIGCARRLRLRPAQDHPHDHPHDGAHELDAAPHRHGWRTHTHGPAGSNGDAALPGIGGLLAIGVAGGLVPSTAALVLLLAAVAAGQPAYGMALALAFGVGMAAVLSGIGLAIVQGRERLGGRFSAWRARLPALQRVAAAAPWAIAVMILAGGLLLTGQALSQRL